MQDLIAKYIYYRPLEFTVMQSGKHLAGGLQSGHTVNLSGVQYEILERWNAVCNPCGLLPTRIWQLCLAEEFIYAARPGGKLMIFFQ